MPLTICDVIYDVATKLFHLIKQETHVHLNENEYRGKRKLGDLHVYCGPDDTRPMQFVKA